MKLPATLLALMATLLTTPLLSAQDAGDAGDGGRRGGRGGAIDGIAPGDPLPDVSAFDAEGNAFHFRDLKGQHTVLVFGCLT